MTRPPLEVADIVRWAGQSFVERNRKWINGQHEKVLLAIIRREAKFKKLILRRCCVSSAALRPCG